MILDENIGFSSNPFSKKYSEQELIFLNDIFYEPNYYSTLLNDLSNGDSRFIIGQRGHGKSSIINKLLKDLEEKNVLCVKIDRFDNIPIKKNEIALLKKIIQELVTKTSIYLESDKKNVKKLSKIEKEKLCLFIRMFFKTLSKTEYSKIYNSVHKIKTKNLAIKIFNFILLKPTNYLASAGVSIGSSFIPDSLGMNKIEVENVYRDYFGSLKEIEYDNLDFENEFTDKNQLKIILDELLLIIQKVGYKTSVILFDKIDEFQELDQNINKISEFTSEILTDTELLLNDNLAIGFSLWSELKSELAKKVRFDKFESIYPSKIGKNKDIKTMINRLLKVRHTRFTNKHLTDAFNQRTSQSEGQLKLMLQYKLIKEDEVLGENSIRYYDVIDKKVEFLIRRNITRLE